MNGPFSPATVTSSLDLRLVMPGSEAVPVPAALRYDSSDPYAVHVTFHTGVGEEVEWVFARELLSSGLHHRTGDGDVTVWPSGSRRSRTLCIGLTSPSGSAVFEAPAEAILDFLTRSYGAVPPGAESAYVDVDNTLTRLLAS